MLVDEGLDEVDDLVPALEGERATVLGGLQGKPAPLRFAGRAARDPGPRLRAVRKASYEGRALLPLAARRE